MENPYIIPRIMNGEDLVLADDANNDHQILFDLTLQLQSVISTARYYRDRKGLAINHETADHVIDALDDILFNIIRPHQEFIDEALAKDQEISNV
tara:strand:- start:2260 stop:2544 length:285 start_codon:yes stop_codon:yes gene_type:complete